MAQVEVRGDIISNDDKWIYDWLEWDATCPNDIKKVVEQMQQGEELTVIFNSGGGSVMAGQEMASIFMGLNTVARITSWAASAAGVAAVGCKKVQISPVGMIMIHNVSVGGVSGDYHDMEKMAETLKQMNEAMANAYVKKSGKSMNEVLELMDKETWLTADKAIEYGFADEIMGEGESLNYTNGITGMRLTDEIRKTVMQQKAEADAREEEKKQLLEDLDLYGV